jgi:23S rRNA (adenine2503-C2)-methyltransferase
MRDRNGSPEIVAVHREAGVVKLGLALADGAVVECVLIPSPTRDGGGKLSLCLSTQIGCRMGCRFCATGRMGFVRDMTAEEIASQVAAAERLGRRPDNLVFMGMGEPLDNFDAWHGAVLRLVESRRRGDRPPLAYSANDMTVSTCGHVDGLGELARRGFRRMGLAVSLNAPNDAIRSRLMPVNRRWAMAELREALQGLPLRNRVFLAEYVVFEGLNDMPEHARELAAWLEPFRALVNLIAYNPAPGFDAGLVRPTHHGVERFRRLLEAQGVFARVRESKGRRILAACGQLASGYGSGK